MRKTTSTFALATLATLWAAPSFAASCHNTANFENWLTQFKKDAIASGISPKVVAEASPELYFDPQIIKRDHGQAVFNQTFLQFSDRMVGGYRIPNGQKKMQQHAALFRQIEQKYGVPAPVITAFWGLESDFGADFGKFKILPALATLAYDCRRGDYFRPQLMDALRLIQRGDQKIPDMVGAWAGEFGGIQITASDYYKYGVDGDGDGRRDLIKSVPDTLASAGNFLEHLGWRRGEPWFQEVHVPHEMPWQEADINIKHPVSQWEKWGVRPAYGKLPNGGMEASLILPMGRHGPAFLAYPNFQAFLGWNSAYVYSTTVAYFATRLNGAPVVDHEGVKEIHPLSGEQVMELQRLLNKRGWNVGDPDGKIGNATRTAVKEAQLKFGVPADSYPTAELLERLGGAAANNARAPEGAAPKPAKRAPRQEHRTQR
ncbi:MAG TPA: lytic murein transglycosylase [Pseudolabrys sp.]|nr:lytic murein transglycosylase [Pseudolabrys sp.]